MFASNLLAARSQMAFTLGFHILLVPLGLCLPLFALIANAYGLRHHDRDASGWPGAGRTRWGCCSPWAL